MRKRVIAFLLTVLLVLPMLPLTGAAKEGLSDGWYTVPFTKTGDSARGGAEIADPDALYDEIYEPTDVVRVLIVLNDAPALEIYPTGGAARSKAAASYRAALKNKQNRVAERISTEVLDGKELNVVWNLTLSANLVSAYVEYGKLKGIRAVSGVKSVFIENRYGPEEAVETSEGAAPEMITAVNMTDTPAVWTSGLTGAGTSVAIIDTGMDELHLSFDEGAFLYAISTLGETVDLLTKEDVAAVLDQLHAKERTPSLTADDVYRNAKIPFAYNYVDNDNETGHVTDSEGNHGSHVAGIAAANRYVPDGNGGYADAMTTVKMQGQAPDAQIFNMKVFGKNGGAYDSDYMAAAEDSFVLGAASVNLSLGSAYPNFSYSSEFETILDGYAATDTVVATSGGNSGTWMGKTMTGMLYAEDKSFSMIGPPGSYYNYLTVASVDNTGKLAYTITAFGREIIYGETVSANYPPLAQIAGEYPFVAVDGFGYEEEFDALSDILPGKIALCRRGTISFAQKANNAAKYGAAAIVICNNSPASISMNLAGYEYDKPVVMIPQEDAAFVFDNAEQHQTASGQVYYTGSITIGDERVFFNPSLDYYTMSAFSSWGIPGSLVLKPEITAPGGGIYSVGGESMDKNGNVLLTGNDKYIYMSGTSMACPQIAGISALLAEYIDKNDLVTKTGLTKRQLMTSLMMGTAAPILEESTGSYYSLLNQGAGLVNADAAISTHTYLKMHEDATVSYFDGKVKAEVGEVSRDGKTFNFTFDVNNFGDATCEYLLSADFFTQDYHWDYAVDSSGELILDGNGDPVMWLYADTGTAPLKANVVWTVNGEVYTQEDATKYDFNGDGVFTHADIETLLNYVVGNIDTISCPENADVNGDGQVTSYDAYLALREAAKSKITVAAGESAVVNVKVELLDIDDFDVNGAYIEGFVYAAEKDGVVSSIPVIGFYGDWSASRMFDYGWAIENLYGAGERTPYMAASSGKDAETAGMIFTIDRDGNYYASTGNPYIRDSAYHPERISISPDRTIAGIRFPLLRTAAAAEAIVTDGDGNILQQVDVGACVSAYYEAAVEGWQNRFRYSEMNYSPADLQDGDVFTVTLRAAPEYYTLKGPVDWDALSENTRFSQTFTVDGTAPEILAVDVHYSSEKGGFDAIKVTARDNRFIAGALLYDEDGNRIGFIGSDENNAAGDVYENTFDLTEAFDELWKVPDHLKAEVCDYAGNNAVYFLNLNPRELHETMTITANVDSLEMFVGMSYTVGTTLTPWGRTSDIVWTSDDESVATVADGLVTATGLGDTVIRAVLVDESSAALAIPVSVFDPNKQLNGFVYDTDSTPWPVSVDTATLPAYTKASENSISMETAFYDEDGTLYGSEFGESASTLYMIDETDFTATAVGDLDSYVADMAAAPALSALCGKRLAACVMYTDIFWIDLTDASTIASFDCSASTDNRSLVGIAYAGSTFDDTLNSPVDFYYLLDTGGDLYAAAYTATDGSTPGQVLPPWRIATIGDPVDIVFYQSLYLDTEGALIWSRTNESDDFAQIVSCPLADQGNFASAVLGCFEDAVWPFTGVYEPGKALVFDYAQMVAQEDSGASPENAPSAPVLKAAPGRKNVNVDAVSFDVVADRSMHNGKYTVYFDPTVYRVTGLEICAELSAYSIDGRTITFAFVEPKGFAEGETVATVSLQTVADGSKTVTITAVECDDSMPGTAEQLFRPADTQHVVFSIKSVGEGAVHLTATDGSGETVDTADITNGVYSAYLPAGSYRLTLTKADHEELVYEFSVTGDVFHELTLRHICDANADGRIDITDVTALLTALSGIGAVSGDPNGDGALSIGDVTTLLNFLARN